MEKIEIIIQLGKYILALLLGALLFWMIILERQQLELLEKILDICSL